MKYQLIYLVFASIAYSCFSISCSKKLSTAKDNSHFECGAHLEERYFKINSEGNEATLEGRNFKVVAIDKATKKIIHINPTSKGCVTENMLKGASSVLVRKDHEKIMAIDPKYPPWGKNITLANPPKKIPEANCSVKNIISGTLNPLNFFDVNNVDLLEYYYVSGKLKSKSEDKEVIAFEKVPLMYGDDWDITNIEEGLYSLELEIKDEVRGVARRIIKCDIDTEKHKLYVTPGDKIKEYRKYFGKDYAVVEEDAEGRPYTVNFYEGGVKNIEIFYCLQRIQDPANEGVLDAKCNSSNTYNYKAQEEGVSLKEGFWNLTYKYTKGEIKSDWKSQRIMVKKVCKGTFYNPVDLKARGCTDIQGSIYIQGNSFSGVENNLTAISSVESHLVIEGTNLSSIYLPNLTYVSILNIKDNAELRSFSFKELERVGVDIVISGNTLIEDLSGISNIATVGKDFFINVTKIKDLSPLSSLTLVGGTLDISGNTILEDVSALSNVTSVGGLVISYNDKLQNLSGLSNLTSIGGFLDISDNKVLEDISGLSNLTSVRGGVDISDNKVLENISALSNIKSVGGLDISYNDKLRNLSGLSNIITVSGSFYITGNKVLEDISALSNVAKIDGFVEISNNSALEDISSLSKVTSVGGMFLILYNTALKDISGFANLVSIGEEFNVMGNVKLKNISGFANLDTIGGYVDISENGELDKISGFSKLTSVKGNVDIYFNDMLKDVTGFSNLSVVEGDFSIDSDMLRDISGLLKITDVSGDLSIESGLIIDENLCPTRAVNPRLDEKLDDFCVNINGVY